MIGTDLDYSSYFVFSRQADLMLFTVVALSRQIETIDVYYVSAEGLTVVMDNW